MSTFAGWTALLGLLVCGGCALLDSGCPCGSDPSDPLAEHDLAFAGDHVVDDQCVCRCGDREPEAFPKRGSCEEHETACEEPEGTPRRYTCH